MKIEQTSTGFFATSGNLSAEANFCDGVLYWGLLGISGARYSGQREIDQKNIDADSKMALKYAEVCIRNAFERAHKEFAR